MLFLDKGYRNEIADCCENLLVEIEPKHPDPKNCSSVDENLLDVNLGFHNILSG